MISCNVITENYPTLLGRTFQATRMLHLRGEPRDVPRACPRVIAWLAKYVSRVIINKSLQKFDVIVKLIKVR